MSKPSDLVQGTVDLLRLKVLALEPLNSFAVSQRLKQISGDVVQVSDGSLHPAFAKRLSAAISHVVKLKERDLFSGS